jgi:hypothetical protein
MKKWFEKWQAEKQRRKEKKLPAIVDYRDITYVSTFRWGIGKMANGSSGSQTSYLYIYH